MPIKTLTIMVLILIASCAAEDKNEFTETFLGPIIGKESFTNNPVHQRREVCLNITDDTRGTPENEEACTEQTQEAETQ